MQWATTGSHLQAVHPPATPGPLPFTSRPHPRPPMPPCSPCATPSWPARGTRTPAATAPPFLQTGRPGRWPGTTARWHPRQCPPRWQPGHPAACWQPPVEEAEPRGAAERGEGGGVGARPWQSQPGGTRMQEACQQAKRRRRHAPPLYSMHTCSCAAGGRVRISSSKSSRISRHSLPSTDSRLSTGAQAGQAMADSRPSPCRREDRSHEHSSVCV